MSEIDKLIENRVDIIKRKIELLQKFIDEIEIFRNAEMDFEDISREIDEQFCLAYHSHPLPTEIGEFYTPDCYYCPLDYCSFRKVVEKVNKCFDSVSKVYTECRNCELLRICSNIVL